MSDEDLPREHPADGYRWVVAASYHAPKVIPCPDKPGWRTFDPEASPDEFFVADAFNWDIQRGTYSTEAEAQARADRLNREDAQRRLDPDPMFVQRRKRLRRLGETFGVRYGEGHPESRWPSRPGRYAVEEFSERYGESFWETCETRAEVEEAIRGGADRAVDLDTGAELRFEVEVVVQWPG